MRKDTLKKLFGTSNINDLQKKGALMSFYGNNMLPKINSTPGVYIIKAGIDFYKIGVSFNPETRIRELQTGNPFDIVLIHYRRNKRAFELEQTILEAYKHKSVRGEWLKLNQEELLEVIGVIDNFWS